MVFYMKTTILKRFVAISVCASALITVQAEKVQIEQLPQGLQEKIRAYTGANRIQDIDMQTKDGQVTYQVGFKQNDQHTELLFNSEGQLLNREGGREIAPGKIDYQQLPAAVQQIVNTRVQQGEINDIDRRVKNGEVTYEVGFKHNGVQQELLLSETGRILRDVSYDQPAVGAPANAVSGRRAQTQMLSPTRVQLSSAQKVELSEIPAEAAQTILSMANGARIEDLEVGTWNNMRVYQAAFKSGGQNVELQVAPNGLVVHSPLGVATPDRMLSRTQVQLSDARKVELRNIPGEAARTILRIADGANIQDLEVGTWNNMQVYQAAFKSNGQNVELQVSPNGQVVFNPLQVSRRQVGGRRDSELFPENDRAPARRGRAAIFNDNLPANNLVSLSSSQVIGQNDLPQAVRTVLNQRAPGAEVQTIQRGIWTDRIVYQIGFVDDGRLQHLQLDQTGKLIHDTRFSNRQ